jgi:RecA-family ATPase
MAAREAEAFRPEVVFIDAVARTTAVAVFDNDSVTELYAKTLAPLALAYDLTLVLVHHERKSGAGDRSECGDGRPSVDRAG